MLKYDKYKVFVLCFRIRLHFEVCTLTMPCVVFCTPDGDAELLARGRAAASSTFYITVSDRPFHYRGCMYNLWL